MAVIHDMIPAFELFQPADTEGAVALLRQYGDDAWVLAGGLDSMDWFKDRAKRPKVVVDVGGIAELSGIRETEDGGFEIGAMTTLTDVERHEGLNAKFGLLTYAARMVATPQIRNQGTLGGNLAQDTRCWYYRGGYPCYRAGGNICYADTPTSMNREHCLFGASRCVAVNPSDTAPALVALDAQMVIQGPGGQRTVDAEDFFLGPAVDIMRMTQMESDEMLVKVVIPGTWANARWSFEKARDRKSWDFALVSIAGAFKMEGDTVADARLVAGSVAPTPMRLRASESAITNKAISEGDAQAAGEAAVRGARVLRHNGFKVPMMRNLVRRTITDSSPAGPTSA